MANLIPTEAKKELKTEYWIRVVTVWFVMVGFGLLVTIALKVPTYALLQTQQKVHAGAYNSARETQIDFDSTKSALEEANQLASLLNGQTESESTISLTTTLDQIAGEEINLASFSYKLTDGQITSINVSGVANTRLALAQFRDDLESNPDFGAVNLPISNLAKDVDIAFDIDITPNP